MNKNFECPICKMPYNPQRIDLRLELPIGDLVIYRCLCGLGYSNYAVQGIPTDSIYDASYFNHMRFNDEHGRKEYIRHLIPYFERAIHIAQLSAKQGSLLDVGCATGDFLDYAVKAGWEAEGTDISGYAVAKARERGLRAFVCSINELAQRQGLYNVITLWDVIEHLPDITNAMKVLSNKLLPGGIIIIKTVSRTSITDLLARVIYAGSLHYVASPLKRMYVPGHLYYFTPRLLRKFISMFGETVFITQTDPPPEALVAPGLMRIGLITVFFVQKVFGMTYELVAALMPKKVN